MHFCDRCKNSCRPWSDELYDEGYRGCTILLQSYHKVHQLIDPEYDFDVGSRILFDYIDTPEIGFGWIKVGGGRCVNMQPLLNEVNGCDFLELK